MVQNTEAPTTTSPENKSARPVRRVVPPAVPLWSDQRGEDGDRMTGQHINTNAPMSEYSEALAKQIARSKAQEKLANDRKGTGQVNIEQPTTGGKVEPDERDGVRH